MYIQDSPQNITQYYFDIQICENVLMCLLIVALSLLMLDISTCRGDKKIPFYQYQCHFDIWLHLRANKNPVKSVRMTLIWNWPTRASSLNIILTLCRVCTSSPLYTIVGNLSLLALLSSLVVRSLTSGKCLGMIGAY